MNSQIYELLEPLVIPPLANLVVSYLPQPKRFEVGTEYEVDVNYYSKLKMRVLNRRATYRYKVEITVQIWTFENSGWDEVQETNWGTRKIRVDRRRNGEILDERAEIHGATIEA